MGFTRRSLDNLFPRRRQMTFGKSLLAAAVLLTFAGVSAQAAPAGCKEPATGTDSVPVISPPLANVVTGAGRLQFYSAPYPQCAMNGVFVILKDVLISYAETSDGWTSVMYTNPRTNDVVQGWVKSARLKQTGTMGPKY
jgi:hypothetical protein